MVKIVDKTNVFFQQTWGMKQHQKSEIQPRYGCFQKERVTKTRGFHFSKNGGARCKTRPLTQK
jgi:hypothetical protein